MAISVIAAFNEFIREYVNLDPAHTRTARRSRDWLFLQIDRFPETVADFPNLYSGMSLPYGSFSRGTKIPALDDIDLISCMSAEGGEYEEVGHDDIKLLLPTNHRLAALCDVGTNELNSRRVVNKYVAALSSVAQYREATMNRRGEAATLKLTSYAWNFDIVPAFHTSADSQGKQYYIIPNGTGRWKKADPRIDAERVRQLDLRHAGNMRRAIRLIKYWHRRPTMLSMPSYLLECIVLDYYEARASAASEFPDLDLAAIFDHVASAVFGPVEDPKGIQSDLNDLDMETKISISSRAALDSIRANEARDLERSKRYADSIDKWREIFGNNFPNYG